jgi:hypothetical protein
MRIYENMMYLALGGKRGFNHSKGKENKNVTYIQDFLSEFGERHPREALSIHTFMSANADINIV